MKLKNYSKIERNESITRYDQFKNLSLIIEDKREKIRKNLSKKQIK